MILNIHEKKILHDQIERQKKRWEEKAEKRRKEDWRHNEKHFHNPIQQKKSDDGFLASVRTLF